MCGIVGYVGERPAVDVLVAGLKQLEYRGYDSAGVAIVDGNGALGVRRAAGKLVHLEEELRRQPLQGLYGVGHTRWATHGRPTEDNAHPHRDVGDRIAIVHNGIIENFLELRERLQDEGYRFRTETDTEAVVHLVSSHYEGDLEAALRASLAEMRGIYAIAAVSIDEPQKIVIARLGPPLVIGIGDGEGFVASDVPPILRHTRDVMFLDDGQMAVVTPAGARVTDFEGAVVEAHTEHITWDPVTAEKGGYRHFMLKEIHEQPEAVRDSLIGRVLRASARIELDELNLDADLVARTSELILLGCGTSWHASLVGRYWIEQLARIPVTVDYASEFRYRDPLVAEGAIACAITQSGETADTIAAMREAKERGATLWAICNVVGSMATRLADGVLYTHAGPEIGVASTKAFVTQLTCLYLIALKLAAHRRTMTDEELRVRIRALEKLPGQIDRILSDEQRYIDLARRVSHFGQFLFIGRGTLYPIALEGALKLKEVSYIHAHGYPAGEMKHGPIALIDRDVPIVAIAPDTPWYEKTFSNMQEAQARDGFVIGIGTDGDDKLAGMCDELLSLPPCLPELAPLLAVVPLQLLAYHVAVHRGCDVDQPRNLAKSVTVE